MKAVVIHQLGPNDIVTSSIKATAAVRIIILDTFAAPRAAAPPPRIFH